MTKRTLRTDREILRSIYEMYYKEFISFEQSNRTRETKIYLPINIPALAKVLKMEPELVFGRLYYHLAPKYGRTDGETRVPFFEKSFPNSVTGVPDLHVVNFPVLESVLAALEYEERKFRLPFTVSAISLAVAILALAINVLLNWPETSQVPHPASQESEQASSAPPTTGTQK
jgi:hypothetical protein